MRIPFKTESDAFRVAVALAALAGAALLLGWLAAPAYGAVLFAAGMAAGITFELAGREPERGSALLEAAHAPHPHGAGGRRHVLVVAGAALAGDGLKAELVAAGGADGDFDVVAPVLASRSHYYASDLDHERDEASRRLEASLAWAARQGLEARGVVGDLDPLTAIEDELRDSGADVVVIAMHPDERRSWLARRMLGHLERELDVPVREVVVGEEQH